MEKIETDTFDANDDRRISNAMRLQSVYCREPMKYARLLDEQMNKAYLPKLKPASRGFYKATLGQIFEMISEEPEKDWNKPLSETYLIGYYLQRNALYTKKNKENKDEYTEE
jgi:CRISPR-associated protein Csd1